MRVEQHRQGELGVLRGAFTANKNANVVGSETLTAPTAGSPGFSCPSGQRVTFVGVACAP